MTSNEETFHFADAWEALETSPQNAANLRLRAKLMIAVSGELARRKLSRAKSAATLEISLSKLSQLFDGDIDAFSVDELVAMAERASLTVDMTIAPRAA